MQDRLVQHGSPIRLIGHIQMHIDRGGTYLIGHVLAFRIEHVHQHHARALGREQAGLSLTHPPSGAGDDRGLAF